jgi:glucokinase
VGGPAVPAPSVVAVDIGGTGIKAARVLLDGRLEGRCTVPTPVGRGPAAVVATVAEVARRLVTPSTLGVGVCVPGLVDAPAAVVRYAPNLGMRDLPLGTLLAAELALPVVMEHDVRAATLAELRLGLGVGADDLLLVALGTGIAAGLVVGGTVAAGATASAGELGHLPVHVGGEPCACGQRGCLEVYASAGGLVRRYRAAGGSPAMSAADLAAAVGVDPLAARVWDDGVRSLGHGLVCSTRPCSCWPAVSAWPASGSPTRCAPTSRRVWPGASHRRCGSRRWAPTPGCTAPRCSRWTPPGTAAAPPRGRCRPHRSPDRLGRLPDAACGYTLIICGHPGNR